MDCRALTTTMTIDNVLYATLAIHLFSADIVCSLSYQILEIEQMALDLERVETRIGDKKPANAKLLV